MKDTKLDGLSFTTENILKFKSEAEWLTYCEGNLHWYEGQPGRIDKLKAVYQMATFIPTATFPTPDANKFIAAEELKRELKEDQRALTGNATKLDALSLDKKKDEDSNTGIADSPEEIE